MEGDGALARPGGAIRSALPQGEIIVKFGKGG